MNVMLCGLGKAGKQVLAEVQRNPETELVCALCKPGSDKAHRRLADILPTSQADAPIYPIDEVRQAIADTAPDVVIDFSGKRATKQLVQPCIDCGVNLVVGTTDFLEKDLAAFRNAVEERQNNAMICSPNITLGVNIMMYLSDLTAACLPNHDFIITEKHYRRKEGVSGTALRLSERLSHTLKRPIGINSVRAGGYIGLHEVLCAGENERITIIHESFSRSAFAQGAILAAKHLYGKKGWHDMDEVIIRYIRERESYMLRDKGFTDLA